MLDLGGTPRFWTDSGLTHLPLDILCLNLNGEPSIQRIGNMTVRVVRGDATDLSELCRAMEGHELVIHLASNPDIAAAMSNPAIDFDQGTLLETISRLI